MRGVTVCGVGCVGRWSPALEPTVVWIAANKSWEPFMPWQRPSHRFSRSTGAMLLSTTRRARTECDVGDHKSVVEICYHASDKEERDFVGEATGMTYRLNGNGDKYYQLLDLGTFGLGVRTSQCTVRGTHSFVGGGL